MNSTKLVEWPHGFVGSLDFVDTVAVDAQLGECAESRAGGLELEVGNRADHGPAGFEDLESWPARPIGPFQRRAGG